MSPWLRRRDDRGTMAVEIVLMIPLLMLILMLIVMLGRYVGVRGDIDAATRDAARAASLEPDAGSARQAATSTFNATIDTNKAGMHTDCGTPQVNLGGFVGGSDITVSVDCKVHTSGLAMLIGGDRDVHASAKVPLDLYRSYR